MASGRCVGQRPDGHTFLCKFFQTAVSCLRLGLFTPKLGITTVDRCLDQAGILFRLQVETTCLFKSKSNKSQYKG